MEHIAPTPSPIIDINYILYLYFQYILRRLVKHGIFTASKREGYRYWLYYIHIVGVSIFGNVYSTSRY